MAYQQNKAIIRLIYEEVLDAGNLELVRDVIAAEAVDHAPYIRSSLPIGRRDAIEDFLVELSTAFPDVYWTVEQLQADADRVVVQTRVSGNQHAEFRGLSAAGGSFTLVVVDTLRLSGGKIVEHWGELDMASLRRQLVAPLPSFGGQGSPEPRAEPL